MHEELEVGARARLPDAEEKPKAFVDTRVLLTRLKGRLSENEGGMVALNHIFTLQRELFKQL